MAMLDAIDHFIVLMLENRSFDSLLGTLYPRSERFNGLTGQESNQTTSHSYPVWNSQEMDPASMSIPDPDPGESWHNINRQLFGEHNSPGQYPPDMSGFVADYVMQNAANAESYEPGAVMHYYTSDQIPVITTLAKQYAVCDQWFASAPCQTWPNRFFLHCGTAGGYENNSPVHFPYLMDTVFNRLEDAGHDWGIYFHDFPQTLTLTRLWPHVEHFRLFDEFIEDCQRGELPAYAFIEPRYFPDVKLPNDQHPPHNVGMGEELIADVYNAVRSSPAWEKSLLVIIYDEHGGCFDHAPPPLAVPPGKHLSRPFAFDRYGVRVPAVIVSPWIQPGTILRAVEDGHLPHAGPPYPFDHTSVIATLRKRFRLGEPLTRRDAVAPDLERVLNSPAADNNSLTRVRPRDYSMPSTEIEAAITAALNDHQQVLRDAAFYLPKIPRPGHMPGLVEIILAILKSIVGRLLGFAPRHATPAKAVPYIKKRMHGYLRKKHNRTAR